MSSLSSAWMVLRDGEEALKRENSLFVATPAQDPQVMAAKAVEIGYDILQGKPAPKAPGADPGDDDR